MRTIFTIFICIVNFGQIEAQVIEKNEHVIVVKDPAKITMPKIEDLTFCKKLKAIKIPDSLSFSDNGRELFRDVWIDIIFDNKGHILETQPSGNIKELEPVVKQILDLLIATKWKVHTSEKQLEIVFRCTIAHKKITKPYLVTKNNFQKRELCE